MNNCQNLYLLSAIACRLADCLSEEELTVLSADLVVLGDMLANLLARKDSPCISDVPDAPSDLKRQPENIVSMLVS